MFTVTVGVGDAPMWKMLGVKNRMSLMLTMFSVPVGEVCGDRSYVPLSRSQFSGVQVQIDFCSPRINQSKL